MNPPMAKKSNASNVSIAKVIEISAQSPISFEDAVRNGVKAASKSVNNIRSAWVKDQEVSVADGDVTMFRVSLKVTFEIKS